MSLADDDRPHSKPYPTDRFWTENYCYTGFDPKSGVGVWLHSGRWIIEPDIWREVVILRFPDGTVAAHRGYGNATVSKDGPGGPNLVIRVAEQGRRHTLAFDGAIRRVPALAMAGQLLPDGPVQRLKFDLEFLSDRPVWDMHGVSHRQDFAGTGHVEQMGTIRGALAIGDERYDLDGLGHRDHSRGPRDSAKLASHHWMQGLFDNGIGFGVYHAMLRGHADPAFAKAAVWEGGALYEGSVELPFMIRDGMEAARPFGFRITYEKGTLDIRAADIVQTAFLSFSVPNEEYVGVFPARGHERPNMLLEQSVFYELADGTRGHGPMERSIEGACYQEG